MEKIIKLFKQKFCKHNFKFTGVYLADINMKQYRCSRCNKLIFK